MCYKSQQYTFQISIIQYFKVMNAALVNIVCQKCVFKYIGLFNMSHKSIGEVRRNHLNQDFFY